DAQHAQKKRRKNDLQAKEQPHGPEQDPTNGLQGSETARSPGPGYPCAARKTYQGKSTAQEQSCFEGYALQNSLERHGAAVKTLGIAEHLGEGSDRNDLRAQQCEDDAENHSVDVQHDARRNLPRAGQKPEDES